MASVSLDISGELDLEDAAAEQVLDADAAAEAASIAGRCRAGPNLSRITACRSDRPYCASLRAGYKSSVRKPLLIWFTRMT